VFLLWSEKQIAEQTSKVLPNWDIDVTIVQALELFSGKWLIVCGANLHQLRSLKWQIKYVIAKKV
jgi:hypothetical protein